MLYCAVANNYAKISGVTLVLPLIIILGVKVILYIGMLLWIIISAISFRRLDKDLAFKTLLFSAVNFSVFGLLLAAVIELAFGFEPFFILTVAALVSILKIFTDFYCYDFAMIL